MKNSVGKANEKNPSVLFIASEVSPFAKVGGLADVIGSLPKFLKTQGCDARVIIPFYRIIKESYPGKAKLINESMIKMGWRTQYCGLYEYLHDGVTYYFVDNEFFFGDDKIYIEYTFDIERFCFFQRAVLDSIDNGMNFHPDILHCNDWQAGMIPCMLKAHYQQFGSLSDIRTVFTIHNLKYQGIHSKALIEDLLDLSEQYVNNNGVLHNGDANFLKAGIVYADMVTTVSENYAKEIYTPEYGEGLEKVLLGNSHKIIGIVNGINTSEYNPGTDPHIACNYNSMTVTVMKRKCKAKLQAELGIIKTVKVPLIGMITRLVDQKGLDLFLEIIEELMEIPVQIAVLGTGDPKYESALLDYAARYPDRISASITFDDPLAHRIYAGADMFMMPSLFEPCGLSQMISMAYGTVPIVRETGGLKDTVVPYNEFTGEGNGFSFKNANSTELLQIIRIACSVFKHKKEAWKWLMINGMNSDFSWNASAAKYLDIYKKMR